MQQLEPILVEIAELSQLPEESTKSSQSPSEYVQELERRLRAINLKVRKRSKADVQSGAEGREEMRDSIDLELSGMSLEEGKNYLMQNFNTTAMLQLKEQDPLSYSVVCSVIQKYCKENGIPLLIQQWQGE